MPIFTPVCHICKHDTFGFYLISWIRGRRNNNYFLNLTKHAKCDIIIIIIIIIRNEEEWRYWFILIIID